MTAINVFRQDAWIRQDPCLPNHWAQLTPEWPLDHVISTDYACRWALVEIDVLVTKAFGLLCDPVTDAPMQHPQELKK